MADRYCSNCGQELNEDTRFCPNCGRAASETAHVPTPEADVPVLPPPVAQQAGGTQDATEERISSGFGRVRGAWDWFLARPVRTKVLLGFAVLVVAIVLSPLWEGVARLLLLASLVALIWCLVRRRPAHTWGIAVVVAAVSMYAFGGVSNALYSETSEQTKPTGAASSDLANADQPKREAEEAPREVESTKEEVAQKDAEGKDTGEDAKSSDGEATPVKEESDSDSDTDSAQKPSADGEEKASSGQAPPAKTPPPTAEEQLYAKIAGVFLLERKPVEETAEHVKGQEFKPSQADGLKQVDITPESQGCRYITVEFYEQAAEFMEFNMRRSTKAYTRTKNSPKACATCRSAPSRSCKTNTARRSAGGST